MCRSCSLYKGNSVKSNPKKKLTRFLPQWGTLCSMQFLNYVLANVKHKERCCVALHITKCIKDRRFKMTFNIDDLKRAINDGTMASVTYLPQKPCYPKWYVQKKNTKPCSQMYILPTKASQINIPTNDLPDQYVFCPLISPIISAQMIWPSHVAWMEAA